MLNRMELRKAAEGQNQDGIRFFKDNEFLEAKKCFLQAIALLEKIPETEYEDHEYRELGKYNHNVATCCEEIHDEKEDDTPDDADQLAKEVLPFYEKSVKFRRQIKEKTVFDGYNLRGDEDRIKTHYSGTYGMITALPILLFKASAAHQDKTPDQDNVIPNRRSPSPGGS